MERTLVLIKPDALARGLVGEVTTRLERKGLLLVGCKMMRLDGDVLAEHYAHLVDKPFYPRIAEFMSGLPVVAQCWEGVDAVRVVREMTGATNSREATPGTIRGDLGMSLQCNVVHTSEDVDVAASEVGRFFAPGELHGYEPPSISVVYAADERT
jgi:nucleoside-diphosphate kinase